MNKALFHDNIPKVPLKNDHHHEAMKWSRLEYEQSIQALAKALKYQDQESSSSFVADPIKDGRLLHWRVSRHDLPTGQSISYLVHPSVVMNCVSDVFSDRRECCIFDDDSESAMQNDETHLEDEAILMDPCCNIPSKPVDDISRNVSHSQWNFSVVYSDTWQVPLLYFTVQWIHTKNGSPCTRSEVLKLLNFYRTGRQENGLSADDVDDGWDFISQEEHPITGIPSFFLHPCQTEDRLTLVLASSAIDFEVTKDHAAVNMSANNTSTDRLYLTNGSLLWTWMSMVLPSVGCPVSSHNFGQVQRRLQEATIGR